MPSNNATPQRATWLRIPGLPPWSLAVPLLAGSILALSWGRPLGIALGVGLSATLLAAVVAAIHHAEVVAHRLGEPFGTLVLAVAVTVIEVALIVALMLAGGEGASSLARDTVFAAVMIVCNGVVGLCLVMGGLRHGVLAYRVEGTSPALASLTALAGLTMVLPSFTTTTPGPTYSPAQLAFAGVASLALYGVFVFVQTVRHRDYFLPVGVDNDDSHAAPPPVWVAWSSLGLLLLSLVGVVGLAKALAPALERYGFADGDELFAAIGYGKVSARQALGRLLSPEEFEKLAEAADAHERKVDRKPVRPRPARSTTDSPQSRTPRSLRFCRRACAPTSTLSRTSLIAISWQRQ